MKFYNVTDEYIKYLKQFDSKVGDNKSEARPYVGVVLKINNISYFAPLSSPKPKHLKMKNTKDFRKIQGGKLGAINFNNMIPIPNKELVELDINSIADVKYRRLLQNQYSCIKSEQDIIEESAKALHNVVTSPDKDLKPNEIIIKKRSCNFLLLEDKYNCYKE